MKKILLLLVLLISCKKETLVDVPPEICIPKAEICDGADNDCDGVIDNEEEIGIKPCYTGNTRDLLYGVCRFGVERCTFGKSNCIGQVMPQKEICDGLDNDCNGETDEGFSPSGLDLVFAIDYSGSMSDKVAAVNTVVMTWTGNIATKPNIRFALVGIPSSKIGYDGAVTLISNLTTYADFKLAIENNNRVSDNGEEASLDAIYKLSDPNNPLGINWSPNYTKAIFVFTDESPQSYMARKITGADAMSMAINNKVKVFIFTTQATGWRAWNPYPLSGTASLLSVDIDAAFSITYCGN